MFPAEWVEEFEKTLDNAPPVEYSVVKGVVRKHAHICTRARLWKRLLVPNRMRAHVYAHALTHAHTYTNTNTHTHKH